MAGVLPTDSLWSGDSKSDDRKSLAKAAYGQLSFLCSNIDALKVVFPSTKEEKDSLGRHCPDPASEELVPAQRRPDRNFYKILRTFVEEMVTDVEKVDLKKVEFGGSEAFHYFKALIPADGRLDNELHIAVKYLMEFNKVRLWCSRLVMRVEGGRGKYKVVRAAHVIYK